MSLKCLIVDDEQLAREMLEFYTKKIDQLVLVQLCHSTQEAKEILSKEKIDLIFLDIQMPQQTGLAFLEEMEGEKPAIVFTTAYPNYAIKGFELNAIDYLLKPISFARFQQATDKVLKHYQLIEKSAKFDSQKEKEEKYIIVHSEHKHIKIKLNTIIYIESLKEYVRYHTTEGRIIEHNTMKKLEQQLPSDSFLRIHRSYIVAISQIKAYENGGLLLPKELILPLGKTYKKRILNLLFKK